MRLDERVVPDVLPDDSSSHPEAGRRGRRRRRWTAVAAVVAMALAVVGGIRLVDDVQRAAAVIGADRPMAASDKTILNDLWRVYKRTYLEPGTSRTLDLQGGLITTSEGQGYTMLRAVWMDDQQTFAESWQWTKDNLQRDDYLLASRFGKRLDGTYGIQDELGGGGSTTGADVDVAFALLMAYSRWQEDNYLYDALPIIKAIWERSVVLVDGQPVLAADDLQRAGDEQVLVDPSYLAPYAYRVFARVDPENDWSALVDNSYALLARLAETPLDADRAAGLPPDRVYLDRGTGELSAVPGDLGPEFGYAGLPLPWRLALDRAWYGEERALRLLEEQSVLAESYREVGLLPAALNGDATPGARDASPAVYGGAMGYFATVAPDLADQVYTDELLPLYDADDGDLTGELSYYDSNWVWFGMALYLDELPNLNVTEE